MINISYINLKKRSGLSNNMKMSCCSIVKIITTLILVVLFVGNSWFIFSYFITSKEMTSNSIKLNNVGKQTVPAILICRKIAYTDVKKNMSRLQDYLDNTLALDYAVLDHINQDVVTTNSTYLERQQIYSFSRGVCEVLKYKPKVRICHCIYINEYTMFIVIYF